MTAIERLRAHGYLRRGSKTNGFSYRPRPSAEELRRIRALRLPPAWREVAIARSPTARLQAIGKDARGRWQYRYHESAAREREDKKLRRLLQFADALPDLRRRLDQDLRQTGLRHDKVMACLVRILLLCFMRPGSREYARENGSYGLCTLKRRHAKVHGDTVIFDFPGKSGKRQHRELRDRRVAGVIRALLAAQGKQLFQWTTDDGLAVPVRRRDVNAYIKEAMGGRFSAKDFRTWSGTLLCACSLARSGVAPDAAPATRKRILSQAIKETAEHLGNTPAVCRASYVAMALQSAFHRGRTVSHWFDSVEAMGKASPRLARACEQSLVGLLRAGSKPVTTRRKDTRPLMTKLGRALVSDLHASH